MTNRESEVWAVTAFFNPLNSERRSRNYEVFRENLGLPLLTVELTHPLGRPLPDSAAEILVRIEGESLIWQKERLINIGVRRLPEHVKYVAWLDSDIVFHDSHWFERLPAVLAETPIAQCFSTCYEMSEQGFADPKDLSASRSVSSSVAYSRRNGLPQQKADGVRRSTSGGMAWAGRRDLIERHSLYDAMIVGGGDRALRAAAFGELHDVTAVAALSGARLRHYMDWAVPFRDAVNGAVGVVDGAISHLWHGPLANRRYGERHQAMVRLGFDPYSHIRHGAAGAWEWTEAAPKDFRDFVDRYFHARNDSGG